jgi:HEAT repeat protein
LIFADPACPLIEYLAMVYELEALLGRDKDARGWIVGIPDAVVVAIAPHLGMIPLTDRVYESVGSLKAWGPANSRSTLAAYLHASFFGGQGGHSCTLWEDGAVAGANMNINDVLARFGVEPRAPMDAFDTVGLGRHRATEDWTAEAVFDSLPDTLEGRIAALRCERADKTVQARVRMRAAADLGRRAAVEAISALARAMREDDEYRVRSAAASALAEMGEPAVTALVAEIEGRDTWNIVFALGKMGSAATGSLPALLRMIRHADKNIRREVAASLGKIDPRAARAALTEALADPDPSVRLAAKESLDRIRP